MGGITQQNHSIFKPSLQGWTIKEPVLQGSTSSDVRLLPQHQSSLPGRHVHGFSPVRLLQMARMQMAADGCAPRQCYPKTLALLSVSALFLEGISASVYARRLMVMHTHAQEYWSSVIGYVTICSPLPRKLIIAGMLYPVGIGEIPPVYLYVSAFH